MLKFILLLIAVRLLLLSTCESASVSKRAQVKLCGRMLAETLRMLCEGQYYDPEDENQIAKRNYVPPHLPRTDTYPPWYVGFPPEHLNNGPFGSYSHPLPMLLNKRQQGGVVDECCVRSCSPTVLMSYCGSGR